MPMIPAPRPALADAIREADRPLITVKRPRPPLPAWKRGPIQTLINLGVAVAITASIALSAAPSAHASEGCNVNAGPKNVTIGALRYVAAVFEDAATKEERYRDDPAYAIKYRAQESVELNNDFLCDVPEDVQPTLQFMTENLLIFIMDIMHV